MMDNSQGYYQDTFDSMQGIDQLQRVNLNTSLHQVTLDAVSNSGLCQSKIISPASLQQWKTLDLDVTQTYGSLTITVLDETFNPLQTILANGSAQSITLTVANTFRSLRLKADFSGTSADPILRSWRLTWVPEPNVLFKFLAESEVDSQGGTVVAGTQLRYTMSYNINNVEARGVVISTTLSAKDGYGTEMIYYKSGSANRPPSSPAGNRFMFWNLGTLTAGTSGAVSFSVDVPDGTTCSWNRAGHIGGVPIALTANFESQGIGFPGIVSSPAGNTQIGSGGIPTYTNVSAFPRDGIGLVRPLYAIPGRPYTYVYRLVNLNGVCGAPSTGSEIMHNALLSHSIPTGASYSNSGLYYSPNAGNGPYLSGETVPGNGNVFCNVGKLVLHSSCACSDGQGVYVYVTINIPPGWVPGSTFTIPAATFCSDQSTTRTASAATVTLVAESTVDANPNSYVSFGIDAWAASVLPCDTIYPYRYIMNQVNKPMSGAYVVEKVPDEMTLQYWDRYCYLGIVNGTIPAPAGNSTPVYYSTTVTADNLPDPPNLASGIWRTTDTAKTFGRITHTLVNLGNLNYSLLAPSHDGMYRMYYTIIGGVGNTTSMQASFYANTYTAKGQSYTLKTATMTIANTFAPSSSFNYLVNTPDPIEAGTSTQVNGVVFGHANQGFVYMTFPPELQYDPTGASASTVLRKSNCAGDHPVFMEYTTTPGVFPFNQNLVEHAAWTRIRPLDTTLITGVRWVLGDWWYYWGGGPPFSFSLSVRGKRGVADNTVAILRGYILYDGLGATPAPTASVTINIRSHVEMSISKMVDKSLLPTGLVRYYLNYANVGNMDEASALMWDKIPNNTEFVSQQPPSGSTVVFSNSMLETLPPVGDASWQNGDWGTTTTWVKWTLPGVHAGSLQSITLTVKPKSGIQLGTVINNTCSFISPRSNTLTSNTVTLYNAPDFSDPTSSSLVVNPEIEVRSGELLRYSLTYFNTGLSSAHNVVMEDTLDPLLDESTLQFIGKTGSYNAGTRTIRWELGDLVAGVGGALGFSVNLRNVPLPARNLLNTARISSGVHSIADETPWVNTNTVSNILVTEVRALLVSMIPRLENTPADYQLRFFLGAGGGLSTGDEIHVEFPASMSLPSRIPVGEITFNGLGTTEISTISGQRLTIPVPSSLTAGDEVVLVIRGLNNPPRGTYHLRLNSSHETTWVESTPYQLIMLIKNDDMIAAPNPAQGEMVKFFYNMQETGEVELAIYNVMGERVAQVVESKSAEKGASSVWHMGKVGSGVYMARITLRYASGRTEMLPVKKVIVIH